MIRIESRIEILDEIGQRRLKLLNNNEFVRDVDIYTLPANGKLKSLCSQHLDYCTSLIFGFDFWDTAKTAFWYGDFTNLIL